MLSLDLLIDLSAVNGSRGRGFDAESDLVASDFQNNYFNCAVGGKWVANRDRLVESPSENKHGGRPSWMWLCLSYCINHAK